MSLEVIDISDTEDEDMMNRHLDVDIKYIALESEYLNWYFFWYIEIYLFYQCCLKKQGATWID